MIQYSPQFFSEFKYVLITLECSFLVNFECLKEPRVGGSQIQLVQLLFFSSGTIPYNGLPFILVFISCKQWLVRHKNLSDEQVNRLFFSSRVPGRLVVWLWGPLSLVAPPFLQSHTDCRASHTKQKIIQQSHGLETTNNS